MPSYFPPLKNSEFIFYVSLVDSAARPQFRVNPTLAAGDVQVATDDGAPANLATLPVVDADFTKRVKVTVAASEMNGDNDTIIFSDVAGGEWDDLTINIQTTEDTYQAKIVVIDDDINGVDRYSVDLFRNGEPLTTGITSPTIQVIRDADGTDLVASTALTEIASTGRYRHAESTNRLVDGVGYTALVTFTHAGASHTWPQPIGRHRAP